MIGNQLADLVEWLRETARPPDGVELRSRDGTTYTGVVVVERSELVLMIAVAHPPGGSAEPERRPFPGPPQRSPSLVHYGLDPDDPRWDRDGDPFRR